MPDRSAADGVDVTVLVVVFNEAANIAAVVQAMRDQSFEGTVEFLFLDGGSTDSTLAELHRHIDADPRFVVLSRPGYNVPARLNLGLRLARGRVIARMDAHSVFPPNYLADGVRRLERGDVAAVGGPQIASGEGTWSRRVTLALRSRLGRGGAQFRHLSQREIEVDSTYCGIWVRSVLDRHQGWNEHASHGEDAELAGRIRRSGGRLVSLPELAARYMPRDSLSQLARQYSGYAYRRAWIARDQPDALRRSQVLPPALFAAVLASALLPRSPARIPRAALKLYAVALLCESTRIGRGEALEDLVALPAVFATMHLAWGAGFFVGCLSHGVPWTALALQFQPRR